MSSTITTHNPRTSSTPKLSNTRPNLSKQVLLTISLQSTYNSEKPLNQHMIKQTQDMYNRRDISNFTTADMALNLLTSDNEFNKFQTLHTNITKLKNTNQDREPITDIKNNLRQQ